MPSIAATIPQYPRKFDLQEVTTLTERQLQSAEASAWLVMEAVRNLKVSECATAIDTVRTLLAATKLAVDQMVVNSATVYPAFILTAPGKASYSAAGVPVVPVAAGAIADVGYAIVNAIAELESVYTLA